MDKEREVILKMVETALLDGAEAFTYDDENGILTATYAGSVLHPNKTEYWMDGDTLRYKEYVKFWPTPLSGTGWLGHETASFV